MNSQKSFRDLEERLAKNLPIDGIRMLFEIIPVQSLSGGGLTVTLIFINDAVEDKEVLNPLDYLQVTMQDEQGWPVQLPLSKNRAQIDTVGPIVIIRPYIVEAFENSLGESLIEKAGDKTIILKAGVTYKIRIQIDKVQNANREKSMLRTTQTRAIDKGKYRINLRLALLSADGSLNRQCESGYEDVELE